MSGFRIVILLPYFGKFPSYIHFFFRTCAYNKDITFLVFTDNDSSEYKNITNIKFIPATLAEFNALASTKLGAEVNITNAYKLCDFKPMYGLIFEDYLKEYDFWGYCDTDIILGDLKNILTSEVLEKYDIISSHPQYMAGPFSLYKNAREVNTLFFKSKDWKEVVLVKNYISFDEAGNVISKLWEGHNIFDFESDIESMTHVVQNKGKSKVNAYFSNFNIERIPQQAKLTWKEGKLTDSLGNELYIFHFLVYKSSLLFNVPLKLNEDFFNFTKYGFFLDNVGSYTFTWITSIITNFTGKALKKVKRKLTL